MKRNIIFSNKRKISYFLLFVFLQFMIGCNYYKVRSMAKDMEALEELNLQSKYFIIHVGEHAWALGQPQLDQEQKNITGNLLPVSDDHEYYKTTKPGSNRYKQKEGTPINEIHIYTTEYSLGNDNRAIIPISSITEIEVYDQDGAMTALSVLLGFLGVVAGLFVVVFILILLFKSSCPFIYAEEDGEYRFIGEAYGGAIYSPLERDDHLKLPKTISSNETIRLQISNELKERQYTNLAQLVVVDHEEDEEVLLDSKGIPRYIRSPRSPQLALDPSGLDQALVLQKKDSTVYFFDREINARSEFSSIDLKFMNEDLSPSGKLVLNARNSYWLDYAFGQFTELFGSYYPSFQKSQRTKSKAHLQKWSNDQGIPLSVYVKKQGKWELVERINTPGPLMNRDIVVPISELKTEEEEVWIRLETGFMFWELDQAAMDFTIDPENIAQIIQVSTAVDEKGRDVRTKLLSVDKAYLFQPEVGNIATLEFTMPEIPDGKSRSSFFHVRGYYEYIRDFKNIPDPIYLNSFKAPGAFTKFSKERYEVFINEGNFFAQIN